VFCFEVVAAGIARVRVDSGGDIEVLEGLLSSMRERAALGDEGAERIITVVEQMIAERKLLPDDPNASSSEEVQDQAAP
jgi:hypothetical protein